MFVTRYLNTPVEHKRFIDSDNIYNASEFAEPETILCRIEADERFKIGHNTFEPFHAYTYITVVKIGVRDVLDGFVVNSVTPIYNFNGSISHYESQVGQAVEM